jgi:DNA ligase-1
LRNLVFLFILTLTCFSFEVQKPKTYDDQNISGWLMSEKLDGIRGYWDGKQLLTKNGNTIHVPKWFTKNFPPFALDGELWSKRDNFEFIQATVLDQTASKDWDKITYNIFEVPKSDGNFTARLSKAKAWFASNSNSHVKIIPQTVCKSEDHLQKYLDKIVSLKGEGIIVKDPTKPYHTGRSPHILKVKETYDMEGRIIGHNLRADGTLKSLVVQLENGVQFNLGGGFSDEQRKNYPNLDQIVTFKYYGFTKYGKPKFASFQRIREKE